MTLNCDVYRMWRQRGLDSFSFAEAPTEVYCQFSKGGFWQLKLVMQIGKWIGLDTPRIVSEHPEEVAGADLHVFLID